MVIQKYCLGIAALNHELNLVVTFGLLILHSAVCFRLLSCQSNTILLLISVKKIKLSFLLLLFQCGSNLL
jgi:hypothetical protein